MPPPLYVPPWDIQYPQSYPKGMRITGLKAASTIPDVKVHHAGTMVDDATSTTIREPSDKPLFRCNCGRVLAVTGIGPNLLSALQSAYKGVKSIDFESAPETTHVTSVW